MIGQIASNAATASTRRLRVWLIVVTVLAGLGLVAAVPGVMFGTYMSAFAADDPSASADAVWHLMLAVWIAGLVYVLLLIGGSIGGWVAFHKRRNRLAFGLSLLAFAPMLLIILAIVALFVLNAAMTAGLWLTPPDPTVFLGGSV
jgi:hypothetical protein